MRRVRFIGRRLPGRGPPGRAAAGFFAGFFAGLFAEFFAGTLLAGIFAGDPAPAKPTFYQHVFPILKKSCVGCHGGERPKGSLSMESFEMLRAGGKKGPPLVPGKAQESLLYLLVSGGKKPQMPPKRADALSAAEIETLRVWIEAGAPPGEPLPAPYGRALEPPVYPRPPVVTALAYSRDGNLLFVAGYREILAHLAEPADGQDSLQKRLVGEAERLSALAVSPDGKLLAAAGGAPAQFGEVQIWEIESWKLLRFFRSGRDTFFSIAFSPDGKRIAFGGADRAVHLLDVETGSELYAVEAHADWIFSLTFSADGSRIISGGRDKTLKVCDAGTGKFLSTLRTFNDPVLSVAAQPETPFVLASGEGKAPVLFDSKELKEARQFEAAPGAILASAFSRDGKLFAVAGAWGDLRVHQTADGARRSTLQGHAEWTYALTFRPDGGRLAAGGYEGTVRIYELKEGKLAREFVPVPVSRGGRS